MDRRLGVGHPPSLPFTLNSAVDRLLKSEFDGYRAKGERHPIMEEHGVDAVPADHAELDDWRNNFKGVQYHNEDLNMIFFGAIDDLWQTSTGEYMRKHPILVQHQITDEHKRSRRISTEVKQIVWARDEGKCQHCASTEDLEFDHIIPFSKGGSNYEANVQLLCFSCNKKKWAHIM